MIANRAIRALWPAASTRLLTSLFVVTLSVSIYAQFPAIQNLPYVMVAVVLFLSFALVWCIRLASRLLIPLHGGQLHLWGEQSGFKATSLIPWRLTYRLVGNLFAHGHRRATVRQRELASFEALTQAFAELEEQRFEFQRDYAELIGDFRRLASERTVVIWGEEPLGGAILAKPFFDFGFRVSEVLVQSANAFQLEREFRSILMRRPDVLLIDLRLPAGLRLDSGSVDNLFDQEARTLVVSLESLSNPESVRQGITRFLVAEPSLMAKHFSLYVSLAARLVPRIRKEESAESLMNEVLKR